MRPLIPFKPMLVYDCSIERMMSFNDSILVEPKLDGIRLLVHKSFDVIKFFTRTERDVTERFSELVPFVKDALIADEVVLDCELCVLRNGRVLTATDVARNKLLTNERRVIFPFDILYLGESLVNESLLDRKSILNINLRDNEHVSLVPSNISNFVDEVKDFYSKIIKAGFEGIVMKNPLSTYQCRRSFEWTRLKPIQTFDYQVISKRLTKDGKQWIYTLADNNKEIGTVMSMQEVQLNSIVEIAYDGNNKRFPRIVRVRDL